MKRTALLALSVFATSSAAYADPGHSMAGDWLHLITQPDHLAIAALLAAAVWFTLRRLRARA